VTPAGTPIESIVAAAAADIVHIADSDILEIAVELMEEDVPKAAEDLQESVALVTWSKFQTPRFDCDFGIWAYLYEAVRKIQSIRPFSESIANIVTPHTTGTVNYTVHIRYTE
jgi:hypothetical protein